jgi:hypothetical protein
MLIDTFINAIFLYDDKMLITFNYKDGTKTLHSARLKKPLKKRLLVRIWIAQLHQKERTSYRKSFLFSSAAIGRLHPSVFQCSGSAKPPLRNSPPLSRLRIYGAKAPPARRPV